MSRAVAATKQKAQQKAAMAEGRDRKADLLSMGLTSTMKKAIGEDKLLCIRCGATTKGFGGDPAVPESCLTKCICSGGADRPPAGYEETPQLIAAAQARHAAVQAVQRQENLKKQGAIANERGKKKDAKTQAELAELDAEYEGISGVEIAQTVELYHTTRPGLDFEKKCVSKVVKDGQAEEQGIKVGWVVEKVNDLILGALNGGVAKKKILVEITKSFKAKEKVILKMRSALTEEYAYCWMCDKFVEGKEFGKEEAQKGEGIKMCWQCEETADMFEDDE